MFGQVKSYVRDYITLMKLEGIETIGRIAGKIVFVILMLLFVSFFILLGSFAGAYYLATLYGAPIGFLIVTGFYLLLILLLIIFKKQFINMVINIALSSVSKKK